MSQAINEIRTKDSKPELGWQLSQALNGKLELGSLPSLTTSASNINQLLDLKETNGSSFAENCLPQL